VRVVAALRAQLELAHHGEIAKGRQHEDNGRDGRNGIHRALPERYWCVLSDPILPGHARMPG